MMTSTAEHGRGEGGVGVAAVHPTTTQEEGQAGAADFAAGAVRGGEISKFQFSVHFCSIHNWKMLYLFPL